MGNIAKGETLQAAGLTFISMRGEQPNREIIVADYHKVNSRFELWFEKNDTPSAHLLYGGSKWEYARSADEATML